VGYETVLTPACIKDHLTLRQILSAVVLDASHLGDYNHSICEWTVSEPRFSPVCLGVRLDCLLSYREHLRSICC